MFAIVLASFSITPAPIPLTSELVFAGSTPDWFVWTAGLTNALGEFDFGLTLPNAPAALYARVWLHGLTGKGFPFHASPQPARRPAVLICAGAASGGQAFQQLQPAQPLQVLLEDAEKKQLRAKVAELEAIVARLEAELAHAKAGK